MAAGANSAEPQDSSEPQPHDDWMGQLLLSRASPKGLSGGGKEHLQEAASVVVCQVQNRVWPGTRPPLARNFSLSRLALRRSCDGSHSE